MIIFRIVQILFVVSSMTSQMIGMMPQEISKDQPKDKSSMTSRMEKMGENLGIVPSELKSQIIFFALQLKFKNPEYKYKVHKKLDVGFIVKAIALNGDTTKILIGSADGILRLWDSEKEFVFTKDCGTNIITSVALNSDSTVGLIGFLDGKAAVCNLLTKELIKVFEVGNSVNSVALSATGRIALAGSGTGLACLYNTSTGELKELAEHRGGISSVALTACENFALTASHKGELLVWNTNTGERIRRVCVNAPIKSLALSEDGSLAVAGTDKGKALILNVETGDVLNKLILTDKYYVRSVALSKDKKKVLTASIPANTVQVWNTDPLPGQKKTRTPLTVLAGHKDSVGEVAFGVDDLIVSGSSDKSVIIWKPRESVTLKSNAS